MHAIGVPEGVTLLEFEGLNSEEHPPAEEQEVQAPEGGVNNEELPECHNHQPSSFLNGKPRCTLSLLHLAKIQFEYFMMLSHPFLRTKIGCIKDSCVPQDMIAHTSRQITWYHHSAYYITNKYLTHSLIQ
jgi:hypothetical protein